MSSLLEPDADQPACLLLVRPLVPTLGPPQTHQPIFLDRHLLSQSLRPSRSRGQAQIQEGFGSYFDFED
jgi:hypothetical protein